MPMMELTEKEQEIILGHRQRLVEDRAFNRGVVACIQYIECLGDQCAGGAGREINQQTRELYGQQYYSIANQLASVFKKET